MACTSFRPVFLDVTGNQEYSPVPGVQIVSHKRKKIESREKMIRGWGKRIENTCAFFSKKAFPPTLNHQQWSSNVNPDFANCGFQLSIETVTRFSRKDDPTLWM